MRQTYITSDQHFFHPKIIEYCERPFSDEFIMNDEMLIKWNETVQPEDLVFHLGDLTASLKGRLEELKFIVKNLNGTKILIRGNHDYLDRDEYLEMGFTDVVEYIEIGKMFLCHYPMKLAGVNPDWISDKERELEKIYKKSKCTTIIHGHHHTRNYGENRFNVSVDLHDFAPVNIDEIAKALDIWL